MTKNILELNPSSPKTGVLKIDLLHVRKSVWIFRAINHKLRQQILKYIAEKVSITVTEIYQHFRLEQSITSQHLAVLRKSGFVKTKKTGKYVQYSINPEKIHRINASLAQLLGES